MGNMDQVRKPTKKEQRTAMTSYSAVVGAISQIQSEDAEIEIEETKETIKIPLKALRLLGDILKAMSEGKPISIMPMATEVTTQKAAEILGCSRPFLVKLLEDGQIPFTKVGKHRRIKMEDVIKYKIRMKKEQKKHLINMMADDEELGLYDS